MQKPLKETRTSGNFYPALLTILVAAASFCTLYGISAYFRAGPNAAILAAVLALSMGRRRAENHGRSLLMELASLLTVGLLAGSVAWLLHTQFLAGAVVFTVGMFLSLWLKRFGERWRQVGTLIALPLVAALVAPGAPHAPGGPLVNLFLVLTAGLVSFALERALRYVVLKAGVLSIPKESPKQRPQRQNATKGGVAPTTRLAFQMGTALVLAFVLGRLAFPEHWGWVVLTAFIVCSGSIGRGEAVYKGLLRFGGALAGTVAAAVLQYVYLPQGPMEAVLIFAALFMGSWLREANYAYWAGCMTLVVALLNSAVPGPAATILGERLLAILLGAVCGIGAAWFVLPIKTESLVRRRLADALLALEEWAGSAAAERELKLRAFQHHAAECERVAPPVKLHRRMSRSRHEEHPAVWLELIEHCAARVRHQDHPHQDLVKSVRKSRKALGEREGLTPALRQVHSLLAGADERP
jgi:hypothetical protein